MDLAWTDYQWAEWRGEDIWLDPQRPLAEKLVSLGADRIYSPTYSLEQQVAEVYHLHLFGGVDPFQLTGIVHAVQQGSGVVTDRYDPVLPSLNGAESDSDVSTANQDAIMDTHILAEWNVSHIVAAYPITNDRLQWVDTVGDTYIYANLDYQPRTQVNTVPDWPVGWPDLPDPSMVERFNQITLITWLVSTISFVLFGGTLLIAKWKARNA